MSVQNKVIDIIAEQAVLDPADVTLDSTLESLGIDSLGLVESIFAIEEAFDIQCPSMPIIPVRVILISQALIVSSPGISALVAQQS